MGKKPKYSREQILDVALQHLTSEGPRSVSIKRIASALGAPSGSIYHRFKSRDHLVAELWLDVVESFQSRFCEQVHQNPATAARGVVEWARENPKQAVVISRYRREDLMGPEWPEQTRQRAGFLGEQLQTELKHLFGKYGKERVLLALVDLPKAAVKRYLGADEMPENLEEMVEEAARAVLYP